MTTPIIVFVIYMSALIGIGVYTFTKTKTYSDYNLAGRLNNKWVTALTAQAAATSGFMLLAMPGIGYSLGFGAIWIIGGILLGTFLNWAFTAKRLRAASEAMNAVSIVEFLEKRFVDNKGRLGIVSAVVVIFFMIVNASAEIVGTGKLFNAVFGIDMKTGTTIALIIVVIYTFLGGYMAVSYSNVIQGSLMFIALLIVPIWAIYQNGGLENVFSNIAATSPEMFVFLDRGDFWSTVSMITGGLGLGLIYFGMVHVLTGFMAIKDGEELRHSTSIAMVWECALLYGATFVGIAGKSLFPSISDPEQIFLVVSEHYFPSVIFAIFAAAVLAAILSSVGAYIIVAAAAFGANMIKRVISGNDEDVLNMKILRFQRIAIVVIALISYLMALQGGLVFTIAVFAAGGLGASFGPVVISSLYNRKFANANGAIASILAGGIVTSVWYYSGMSSYIYEVFPGLAASILTLWLVTKITGGPSPEAIERFDHYIAIYHSQKDL